MQQLIGTHTKTRCPCPALTIGEELRQLCLHGAAAAVWFWPFKTIRCTNEFLFCNVRVQSPFGFSFVFGQKYHLTFGRHLASAESRTHCQSYFRIRPKVEFLLSVDLYLQVIINPDVGCHYFLPIPQ